MKTCFKSKFSALEQKQKNSGYLKMQIYIFYFFKKIMETKMILKNLRNLHCFCHGEKNTTTKQISRAFSFFFIFYA